MPDEMSRRLVDLLEAAINLEYLYLSDIDLPHAVLATVEKLTTLRHLSMCTESATDHPFKLLTTLRSPLEYLRISSVHEIYNLPASFLHHQLAHFAATLEILDLDDLTLDISPLSATSQFASLITLKVVSILNLDQLEVLLRLFPNLDNSLELSSLDRDLTPAITYPAARERNKEVQKICTWPRLDRLTCPSNIAFVLALQCPVRRMDIYSVLLPKDAQYLLETLRLNTPRQLCVALSLLDGLQGLDVLFPLGAAGRDKLTHLVVFVRLFFDDPWGSRDISSVVTWNQILDGLLQSMQHLRIVLHYHTHYYHIHPEDPQMEAMLDMHCNLYAASEWDLARAAARFFSSMSGLRYLFLTTCGYITVERGTDTCRRFSSQAWRRAVDAAAGANLYPSGASGERGLCTAISSETAEAVMDREELRFRENEEDMVQFCCESESPAK